MALNTLFYTDIDAPNKMDDKPFLTLDLEEIDEYRILNMYKEKTNAFIQYIMSGFLHLCP